MKGRKYMMTRTEIVLVGITYLAFLALACGAAFAAFELVVG